MTIVKGSLSPFTHEKNGQWQKVVSFDCRGIEPVEPSFFGTKWVATPFNDAPSLKDVSLEEEWADYDAKNDCAVSILEPEIKVE